MPDEAETYARILVKTQGLWRASQVAEALNALDGLVCRIAAASALADYVQSQDYVINNLRVLGLLKKGGPGRWGKGSGGGMSDVARTDYVTFIRNMRRHGIEVKRTPDTLKFSFIVSDLLELEPVSYSRLEIAEISMASPGKWILTMTGLLAKKGLLEPARRIIDALFFYEETRAKKGAEARAVLAAAKKTESEARAVLAVAKKTESEAGLLDAQADLVRTQTARERAKVLLTYRKAIDSERVSLRNAGLIESEIKAKFDQPLEEAISTLSILKAGGLIEGIRLDVIEQNDEQGESKKEEPTVKEPKGDADL